MSDHVDTTDGRVRAYLDLALERMGDDIMAAIQAEREACARLAEDEARHGYGGTCRDIANAIRARGGAL